jgi:hypothetical protein
MRFNGKEGQAERVVFIPHGPAPKGATGDNSPLRPHSPAAREGEGNGGRPAKQVGSDKDRSKNDDATPACSIRTTGGETVEII